MWEWSYQLLVAKHRKILKSLQLRIAQTVPSESLKSVSGGTENFKWV